MASSIELTGLVEAPGYGGFSIKPHMGLSPEEVDVLQNLVRQGLVVVSVKRYKATRSNQQNRYLWGVVYESIRQFFQETEGVSYEREQIHSDMSRRFLERTRIITLRGEERHELYIQSTTKLDTQEFNDYVENIRAYWAPVLDIPDPKSFVE